MHLMQRLTVSSAIATGIAIALLPSVVHAQAARPTPSTPPGWHVARQGDAITMTPPGLKQGEVFSVTILPDEEPGQRSLRDFLAAKVKEDLPRRGRVVKEGPVESRGREILETTRLVEARGGGRLLLIYWAAPSQRRRFQLVRVVTSPDPAVFGPNLAIAGKSLAGQPAEAGAAGDAARAKDDRPPAREQRRSKKRQDRAASYRTEPGRGIKSSEIEAVMAQREVDAVAFAGGGIGMKFEPVLVFKNGEYCSMVDLPAGDMNAAAHKQANPGAWGRWRRRSGRYQVAGSKGAWFDVNWDQRLTPARAGEELRGTYSSISGGGNTAIGGDVSITNTSQITFLPGRRFRLGSFGMTTFGGSSGVSGVATSDSDASGTYRVEAGTLELRYGDGRVERWALHWGDADTKQSVFFNRSLYTVSETSTRKK
jgi:hypothetical protein